MNCQWVQEHIHSILDGEISSRDRAAFERHVTSCSSCAEFVRRTEEEEALLRSALGRPEAPAGFAEAVMDKVRTSPPAVVPVGPVALRWRRWWPLVGAAAAVAVVYIAIRSLSGPGSGPREQTVVRDGGPRRRAVTREKKGLVPSSPVVATVVSLNGSAAVCASGSDEWRALAVEEALRLDSRLRTDAGTALTIRIGDATATQIDEGSSVRLTENGLFVDTGRVFSSVEPRGQGFVVETPDARATVEGTQFEVDRRAVGMTRLRVVEGTVRFANAKGNVSVGANMEATATAGAGPGRLLHADHFPALAWASVGEESFEFPVDIKLDVQADGGGSVSAGQASLFVAKIDYGQTRYGDLWMYCRVTNNSGAVVLRQRERISSREHRYRIKRIALGALRPGSYTARFRVGHGSQAAVAEQTFTVE